LIWISNKSLLGFTNCIAYQLVLYILFTKLNNILPSLFLIFLTICYTISSFGKYNWGEIPNYVLIHNTIFNDLEILKKYTLQVVIFTLIFSSICFLIYKFNNYFTTNFKNKLPYENNIIILLLSISLICVSIIFIRNKGALLFYKRDILGQDPFLGIFIKNTKYSGDRPINQSSIINYDIDDLQIRNNDNTNIIIIVSDALRPDHMSLFGYPRKTTKYLDSLMICNNNMSLSNFSTSSCTSSFCGITSLLYGKNFEKIPLNKLGIHDILRSHGYTTSFILAGCHKCFYGLGDFYGKNIDNYFETKFNKNLDKNISIYDDLGIVKYLNTISIDNSKPNFMYIHIMAPHNGAVISKINKGPFFTPNKVFNSQITEYDNGVVQADFIINELFKGLKEKGIYDNSIIIITADHGEGLKKNKYFNYSGHGHIPYDEVLNIPLIIIDPKNNNYNLRYTTQIDVVPTLLDRIFNNYTTVNKYFEGVSLLKTDPIDRYTYHLYKIRNTEIPSLAIIKQKNNRPTYKYIFDPYSDKRYIFDLNKTNYDNSIIHDTSLLKEFKSLHEKYIKETFNLKNQ
jgi:glucan phosphoethanolaminetransferase (alkaline phosphatase superfamily)